MPNLPSDVSSQFTANGSFNLDTASSYDQGGGKIYTAGVALATPMTEAQANGSIVAGMYVTGTDGSSLSNGFYIVKLVLASGDWSAQILDASGNVVKTLGAALIPNDASEPNRGVATAHFDGRSFVAGVIVGMLLML